MDVGTVHPKDWATTWPRGWRAMQLVTQAYERHGSADARDLAAALGGDWGPALLPAVGYPDEPALAWVEFLLLFREGMTWVAAAEHPHAPR